MENVSICFLSTKQRGITSAVMYKRKPRLCVYLLKIRQLTTDMRSEPRKYDFTSCTLINYTLSEPSMYSSVLIFNLCTLALSHYTETMLTNSAIGSQLLLNLAKWLLNLPWNTYKLWKSNTNLWETKLLSCILLPSKTLEPHFLRKGSLKVMLEGFIRGSTGFTLNHSTGLSLSYFLKSILRIYIMNNKYLKLPCYKDLNQDVKAQN